MSPDATHHHQTDGAAELRLSIVDADGAEWRGTPGAKAADNGLDGVSIEMLRDASSDLEPGRHGPDC